MTPVHSTPTSSAETHDGAVNGEYQAGNAKPFASLSEELRDIADSLLDPASGPEATGKAAERLIQCSNALVQNQDRLSGEVPPETRRAYSTLSPREHEIFAALGEGLTVNEIAGRLNRSPKTINNHRTHVMHKLKLRNAAELTRLAIRLGIASL